MELRFVPEERVVHEMKGKQRRALKFVALILGISGSAYLYGQDTCPAPAEPPPAAQTAPPVADPFADVTASTAVAPAPAPQQSWFSRFIHDNLGFREELMSEFTTAADGSNASRQSVGFDVLKKFSTDTATIASFDFQGRFVRRDGYNPVPNDMEGATRPGWAFEYHNFYLDLYNVANPVLGDRARSRNVGRFNFRAGHFYVPFGLNLQTDTHGTLLQLSNGDNFGFDRDWYVGFWGAINRHLNYDAYYMAGSGYDLAFRRQRGLGAVRISLSNQYSSKYGLEGGISAIAGERLWQPMPGAGMTSAASLPQPVPLKTQRIGIDARYRHTAPGGLLAFTMESSGGRDARDPVLMQLAQAEYLRASRRWGLATQYRRFSRDSVGVNESIIGEFSWYFRNDVAGSNSHWIKVNVERQLHYIGGAPATIVTLQYYFYR
jgi:hypothetical protein